MQQVRIAIVEDEALHADLLIRHIESWQKRQNMVKLHVQHFCHSAEFLFSWEEEIYDMIFLDIQMPGLNGMETARRIRETDSCVKLVFTTGITDYLQEGYEVEAVRYLLKPITREKVWQCLDKLLQEPVKSPLLLFQSMEGVVKIPEQEIEYLEARGHYTLCYLRPVWRTTRKSQIGAEGCQRTKGRSQIGAEGCQRTKGRSQIGAEGCQRTKGRSQIGTEGCQRTKGRSQIGAEGRQETAEALLEPPGEIQLRESFSALCDRLSQRPFVRCHRSYLCSIARIYRVERTEILLESGISIPLSRRMYEPVTKAFISYFRREEEQFCDISKREEKADI